MVYLESFGVRYLEDGWVDLGDRLDSFGIPGHPGLACTDMEVGQEAGRRRASVRTSRQRPRMRIHWLMVVVA